jgi:hypothetical protein
MGKPFYAMVQVIGIALNQVNIRRDAYGEIATHLAQALADPENRQVLQDFLYGLDGEPAEVTALRATNADLQRQLDIATEALAHHRQAVHQLRTAVARMRLKKDGIGGIG